MKAFIFILSLLIFVGCAKTESVPVNEESVTPELTDSAYPEKEPIEDITVTDTNDTPTEAIWISPLAKEDLLPTDTYSDPREEEIGYVMIHFTSAVMISRSDPYNMGLIRSIFEDNELSIHYIIDRDGKTLCYIPEDRTAWHAGRGSYNGIENRMNHHSVGIELVGMGSEADMAQYMSSEEYQALDKNLTGFTDAQYEALARLVADVCQRNNIPIDREHIIGHSEYNPAKSDPGELFDFDKLLREAKGE